VAKFKVAYIVGRFPTVTETFVVSEMMALERHGAAVEVYPLVRGRCSVMHPEGEQFMKRAHFLPFLSLPVILANLYFIWHTPGAYFGVLAEVLRHTSTCAKFLVGAITVFPKAVRFAYEMNQMNIDHIHAHFAHHPTVVAFIVHRLTGIPFSFTAHGTDLFYGKQQMLRQKVEAADCEMRTGSSLENTRHPLRYRSGQIFSPSI
jgi:colanic acid/amylovoran biosynthesis glycosyltransferase